MEKKKMDFKAIASGAGKSASEFFEKAKIKAVETIDQNADGKLDMQDVSQIASAVKNSVKNTAKNIKESADAKALELEKKTLLPLFDEDIESANFSLTKLIRVCDPDKRHSESSICQGCIGYFTEQKDIRIVNIYKAHVSKLGISFYPDRGYEFYYVDPRDRDRYIALDEYFSYLKVERVNELQRLAQDLGARHFRVTYKEEKVTFSSDRINLNAKLSKFQASATRSVDENTYSTVDIAAEMECPGHAPIEPTTLKYLQNDSSVQNLIALRMNPQSPISHHKFTLKLSNSSGIKESDALKIDTILKTFRLSGNATVTTEAKNESRRYLEYEIDF